MVRQLLMPDPIKSIRIKWYETSERLDELKSVSYTRATISDSVVSIGMGGIFANWEGNCENWKVKWEKKGTRFEFHYEFNGVSPLENPLRPLVPVLRINDRWFKNMGREFNLAHILDNRVNQLLRFLREHDAFVPEGTLFVVTRAGIKDALIESRTWSLILGYSAVEPTPEFSCTPIYNDVPELGLPKNLRVVRDKPLRLSRYERPWVI